MKNIFVTLTLMSLLATAFLFAPMKSAVASPAYMPQSGQTTTGYWHHHHRRHHHHSSGIVVHL